MNSSSVFGVKVVDTALDVLSEYIATEQYSCVVQLNVMDDSRNESIGIGSGVICTLQDNIIVLTAAHVLRGDMGYRDLRIGSPKLNNSTDTELKPQKHLDMNLDRVITPCIEHDDFFRHTDYKNAHLYPDVAVIKLHDEPDYASELATRGITPADLSHLEDYTCRFDSPTKVAIVGYSESEPPRSLDDFSDTRPRFAFSNYSRFKGSFREIEIQNRITEVENELEDFITKLNDPDTDDTLISYFEWKIRDLESILESNKRIYSASEYSETRRSINKYPLYSSVHQESSLFGYTLPGDSGGGMFLGDRLVGLNCGRMRLESGITYGTGIYLHKYYDWIKEAATKTEPRVTMGLRSVSRPVIDGSIFHLGIMSSQYISFARTRKIFK